MKTPTKTSEVRHFLECPDIIENSLKELKAYEKIKELLSSTPILSHPNFDYPFILQTDASDQGLGAILSQRIKKKKH